MIVRSLYSLSAREQADLHFIYGFCNGNSTEAAREYAARFPSRPPINPRTFTNVHQALRENGIKPQLTDTVKRRTTKLSVRQEESIINLREKYPTMGYRKIAAQVGVSIHKVAVVLRTERENGSSTSENESDENTDMEVDKNESGKEIDMEDEPIANRLKRKWKK